ncbi:MAG TPA: hypothetical protein VN495_02735, partial [Candidatus Paceibacterota bacterium]|nr:hypothetical protein [Candidatus Paceibacterota bacterium]
EVRDAEIAANNDAYSDSNFFYTGTVISSALRANITLPKEVGWDANPYGGHSLEDAYLANAAPRIAGDISAALNMLSVPSQQDAADPGGGCFTPPTPGIAYTTEKTLLGVADTFYTPASDLRGAVASVGSGIAGALTSVFSGVETAFRSSNRANATSQVAAASGAFAVAEIPSDAGDANTTPTHSSPAVTATANIPADDTSNPPASVVPGTSKPLGAPTTPTRQPWMQNLFSITPGFGGGGSSVSNSPVVDAGFAPPVPSVVALSVLSPADGSAFANSSITFAGTADFGAIITASSGAVNASTTADLSGAWQIALTLPEGSAQVAFTADDPTGAKTENTATRTVIVDLTPPDAPTISIPACADSFSSSGCVIPITSATVQWNAAAGASSYALATNGIPGTSIAGTSTTTILASGATTTLAVVAYDEAGNAATSSLLDVAAISPSVIINEIGWGGTGPDVGGSGYTGDSAAQWIELKNLSPYAIDLSSFAIERSGGASIPLSGTLAAKDSATPYRLIDTKSLATSSFSGPETTIAFTALPTASSDQLTLSWQGNTIDQTPPASACGGAWCAGSASAPLGSSAYGIELDTPLSMERASDTSDGTLPASWHTTDSYGVFFGIANNKIWGTPDADSSAGLADSLVYCAPTDTVTNIASANENFDPGTYGCNFLSRFIPYQATRLGWLFEGDVGSSTPIRDNDVGGRGLVNTLLFHGASVIPAGTDSGTHFFFTIFETRFPGDSTTYHAFESYFETGSPAPPNGSYVIIPFLYQP